MNAGIKPYFAGPRRVEDDEYIEAAAWAAKQGHSMPKGFNNKSTKTELLTARNDYRRLVNVANESAKELIDKPGSKSDEIDAVLRTVDVLARLVAETQTILDRQELANCVDADAAGTWRGSSGQTLRALGKDDKLTREGTDIPLAFGFGEYVAAMVGGTQNQAVRNALSEGTDSAGGFTTPSYLTKQLIDAMRARAVTIQAGAMTLPLDGKTTTIAKVVSDPVAGWRLENAPVVESAPTFGAVLLQPKSLAVLVKVSRELLQDSLNLEQALLQAFAGALAVEVDRASLFGSGADGQPLGLANTAGIGVVSMGVNGAALGGYVPMLDAMLDLETANAATPTAMILNPRTRRAINGFVDSTGQPLRPPAAVESIPMLATTTIPTNQVQGTAVNAWGLL